MQSRSVSFISFAGVLILAIACSADNPAGPDTASQINSSGGPLSSTIKSDVASAAGNAIAAITAASSTSTHTKWTAVSSGRE